MIARMYCKKIKQFFRKPFNVLFMLAAPVVLILLMGYAMSNLIGSAETESSSPELTVLYLTEKDSPSQYEQKFTAFQKYITASMNISFKETDSFVQGCQEVDKNKAAALIKVSTDGFYYYRSPYNEPTEGKMLRTAFHTLMASSENAVSGSYIDSKVVPQKTIDSYTYFTFAELGFIMIYLCLIIGQSVYAEKETRTYERICISKASTGKMLISKIAMGVTIALIQIFLVYMISVFALQVDWGNLSVFLFFLYLLLALFSSAMGAVTGLLMKKKTSLNDLLLMISIFIGFLGGGLTPLSFLDTVKAVSVLCKLSPLYWVTNSAIILSSGKFDVKFAIAVVVCLLMTGLMAGIYFIRRKNEKGKGIYVYA